ncbi:MAG: RHS repeat-associated core domain-containing protein [Caldilineaceae bacterium]|nr:RHS repeat-associated core domain-containing protein [Caldilineaceae bacterium]
MCDRCSCNGGWSSTVNLKIHYGTSLNERESAYGTTRSSNGTLPTDRTFTDQKADSTGLLYLNARYYDPSLGTFLSPDTLVPDTGRVFDYNRFAYARLNPLKYTDPMEYLIEDQIGMVHFGNHPNPSISLGVTQFKSVDAQYIAPLQE